MKITATTRNWSGRRRVIQSLAVLSVAAISAAGLAGCAGGSSSSNATSNAKVTLTEWDYYNPTNSQQGIGIKWLYDEYHKTHPNVTIQRTIVPGTDLAPKLLSAATTNTLPDIAIADTPIAPVFAATGKLQDIGGALHGGAKAYLPGQAVIGKGPDGKLNAIFMGVVTLAIFYNKDMFAAAGITKTPATWPEFEADAQKLTKPGVSGFLWGAGQGTCGPWQFNPWQWSAGGKDTPTDSAGNVKALTFLTSLVNKGITPKSVVNSCQDDTYQQFAQGQAAMMENGAWNIDPLNKAGVKYGIFKIPVPAAGDKLIVPLGGEMFTLPKTGNATNEAAAQAFLKWSQTPSVLKKFNEKLGYIPAQEDLWKGVVAKNPLDAAFVDALPNARGRTDEVGVKYPQWSQAMVTALGQSLLGTSTPQQALQNAGKAFAGS